jgi:hypothetical protein
MTWKKGYMGRRIRVLLIVILLLGDISLAALAQPYLYTEMPGLKTTPSSHIISGEGYWETPMDITNTKAVWEMLMAPVTVVKGKQKTQQVLYTQPDENSVLAGEVTRDSQSVHVLETLDNGWSLVECYSSSFAGGKTEFWNELVQGYIRTDMLETLKPAGKYGLVVDKLDQRMYIFQDGEIYDVLSISTGLINQRQPYNETRSGEFLIVSPVGGFMTDDLYCDMGLRFNAGDILHEVPHLKRRDGTKYYDKFEDELGVRASHGCIRVQRKRTPKGTNMTWVWNTLGKRMGTKLVIWEDVAGRQLPHADSAFPLYYNTSGGQNYHIRGDACYGVRDRYLPLTGFTYGELGTVPYEGLTPCQYCNPPRRPETIDAINLAHRLP